MIQIHTLRRRLVRYSDLTTVHVHECGEPLIDLTITGIRWCYMPPMTDMKHIIGNRILLRNRVAQRLVNAQKLLSAEMPEARLMVTYGYRSPEVQMKYFTRELNMIKQKNPTLRARALYERVHKLIAVPTVAGHPTGGAVDVCLWDRKKNTLMDCGSTLYDFTNKKCAVFAKPIHIAAKRNRLLLRKVMCAANFAPYDGEWWHFSYGDREWAFYYNHPSFYDHIPIGKITRFSYNRN